MSHALATPDPETFALEDFLPYRLSLLSNTVSQGISAAYRKVHGLSVMEWRIVALLGRFPGLTATEVTARGAMDKVAVHRAVNKLRDKDIVKRTPQPKDRRRLSLELTRRKGWPLFHEVVPKALAYERGLLAALEGDELSRLNGLLTKLQSAADSLNETGS